MTNSTTTKTTRKTLAQGRKPGSGRIFNPSKYAINRAWEIARNAAVAHNTNPLNVAQKGLVKPTEFFAEALRMAWVEAKAKQAKTEVEMYKLHKVPKKSLTKILNAVAQFAVVNKLARATSKDTSLTVITKAVTKSVEYKEELSTAIFNARFSTPAARSTNRHTLHALAVVAETGNVPAELTDKVAF